MWKGHVPGWVIRVHLGALGPAAVYTPDPWAMPLEPGHTKIRENKKEHTTSKY